MDFYLPNFPLCNSYTHTSTSYIYCRIYNDIEKQQENTILGAALYVHKNTTVRRRIYK